MKMRRAAAIVTATAIASIGVGPPAAQAAADTSPPGTNDFTCEPSAAHPRPLIMLEGLGGNSGAWGVFTPPLLKEGYCIFTLDYGIDPRIAWFPIPIEGTLPMEQSAAELKRFVTQVLSATGARRFDLVGHSEGTMMPRYYLERLGGARKVKRFVALTPLWRGTNLGGTATLRDALAPLGLSQPVVELVASFCTACTQSLPGSAYIEDLNSDGEAIPGVKHTNIVTKTDEFVTPYTSGIMRDGGTNIVLQDVCPTDLSEHLLVAFDPVVLRLIMNALDPRHARPVRC